MTVKVVGRRSTSTADRSAINLESAIVLVLSGSVCTVVVVEDPAVEMDAVATARIGLGGFSPGMSSTSMAKTPARVAETEISLSRSLATWHSAVPESCLSPVSRTPPPANSLTCTLDPPRWLGLLERTASTISDEATSIFFFFLGFEGV